jgi:hypothetical protein
VGRAAAALSTAQAALRAGDAPAALEASRRLRAEYPSSPLVVDSWLVSVSAAVALGDDFRARYFLKRLRDTSLRSTAAFSAALLVADRCYATRSWLAAMEYYGQAAESWPGRTTDPSGRLDTALLRAGELSLYHGNDEQAARAYFRRIVAARLPTAERLHYRELRVRLFWRLIPPSDLGTTDANVSCLRVDEDDLWIGTWNGGVARYSVSAMKSDPFPGPAFSRSIEVADRRVWVGTAEGLAWYSKGSGRWGTEPDFLGSVPRRVQVVRQAGGTLYAGTLGDGLFRRDADGWTAVDDGDLPGRFITALAPDPAGKKLYIGTMNLGLVILDLETGAMSALSELVDSFTADNVTTVLPDDTGRVWIGTYGEGLAAWRPDTGALVRYTRATGQIGDDWVLAGCETGQALYFGSFGGGVSAYVKATGQWRRLGIADGLASIDVPAIAWRAPFVFFGTLGAGVSVYDEGADARSAADRGADARSAADRGAGAAQP